MKLRSEKEQLQAELERLTVRREEQNELTPRVRAPWLGCKSISPASVVLRS